MPGVRIACEVQGLLAYGSRNQGAYLTLQGKFYPLEDVLKGGPPCLGVRLSQGSLPGVKIGQVQDLHPLFTVRFQAQSLGGTLQYFTRTYHQRLITWRQ